MTHMTIPVKAAGPLDQVVDRERPCRFSGRSAMTSRSRDPSAQALLTLYEISKMLSASLNLERTLLDLSNLLASYLQMRRCTIAVADPDNTLKIVAAAGLSPSRVRNGEAKLPAPLVQTVMSSGLPYVVPDVAAEPEILDHYRAWGVELEQRVSLIAVPIKATAKPFGLIAIDRVWDNSEVINFEKDVRFLAMVANLIGQTAMLHQAIAADRQTLMAKPPIPSSVTLRGSPRAAPAATPGPSRHRLKDMIGNSPQIRAVYAQVHQVAPTRSNVILRGESGTGKELIARAIHGLSKAKDGPFVRVNCAALPEGLLESELFGHEKGAFTGATQERKGRFELADNGTLFLDEIGEISLPFQAKLLRVLQEGEFERVGGMRTVKVNVRLIAATNRNLEEAVAKGQFRGDLYYRINVVPIFVPPLRERRDDIPALAQAFLKRFNEDNERNLHLSESAMNVLKTCKFPGNVRELENCVFRTATMTFGDSIEDCHLACQNNQCLSHVLMVPPTSAPLAPSMTAPGSAPARAAGPIGGVGTPPAPPAATPLPPADDHSALSALQPHEVKALEDDAGLDDSEDDLSFRERLVKAMEATGWVQAKAARMLGITPRQLGYALRKYNIEIKRL